MSSSVAKLPLSFEPNAGRTDRRVDYLAHSAAGGTLFLTSHGAVLSLPEKDGHSHALRFGLVGANRDASATGLGQLRAKSNSFIGEDRSHWRSGVSTYSRVRYEDIYPGINVAYYGNQRDLEYDFGIAPGADPSRIAIELRGADSVHIGANGDLVIGAGNTQIRQPTPLAYQRINGVRREIPISYDLDGSKVRFNLGHYDHSRSLTIDPLVFAYSTYLGGSGFEAADSIAVDAAGAAYIIGDVQSTDFPSQDAFQTDQGGRDVFVAKLNPDSGGAATLAYSTYLGGTDGMFGERGFDIAVDSAGAAYVTGFTDATDFPTQDAFQGHQVGTDAFVTKLNPDSGGAVTLAYSTYLGGALSDSGNGIAVDSAGAAYLTGETGSSDFPTQDAFDATGGDDAFVTKLNPDAGGTVTLAYSTYLGGAVNGGFGNGDIGQDIAVDSAGAAYVTGNTAATDFPTQDAFDGTAAGAVDAFVTKLNPDSGGAVSLAYSTYLGGGMGIQATFPFDGGEGIAVDSAGAAYVVGETASTDFPTQDAFQGSYAGGFDAFLAKLNPDIGSAITLAYSTYLGSQNVQSEGASGVAVDSTGAAYVTGRTDDVFTDPSAADFPTAFSMQPQRGSDAFVTKFNPDSGGPLSLLYSTFLGGTGGESGGGIAVDPSGAVFVAGGTGSTDFPTQDPFQASSQGAGDAFVARFVVAPVAVPSVSDTDPNTPANDNNPEVKGTAQAGTVIRVYDNPACAEPAVGSGPGYVFNSSGVTISVSDNSTTTLYAKATDFTGNTACSATSATYTEVTPAPIPAPLNPTTPPSTPSALTGQRAAALKKCKRKKGKARSNCIKRAKRLPA